MQKKSLETLLYSTAGILVMLVIAIAFNVITSVAPVRLDLTQEKAYTLSAGTRAVLKKLDTPVTIHFYCSQTEMATAESVFLKGYARKVEDLLHEYQQIAGKNLIVQKFDPQPDSDAEDSAKLDGLEPQTLTGNEQFYMGVSVSLADERVAIPFLDPSRERQLEYDLTRAIARVFNPEKVTVGVMSGLPVFGAPANPMMMESGQQGTPAWTLIGQLKQDFNLKRVEMTADKIEDDIKVLLVVHPKDISEGAQYAIDQFILRGGKVIACLDAQSLLDSKSQQNPMMGGQPPASASSSLPLLLKAWGLDFDTGKVVADLDYKLQVNGPGGQPADAPAFLGLTVDAINRDDIATAPVDTVWLPLAGAFTGTPVAGLKETVLLHSSTQAELVDGMMASMGGGQGLMQDFKPTGVSYTLALRLSGKFKTAFPAGKPGETNSTSLKESNTESAVLLFGDADFVSDDFSLRKMQTPFGNLANPLNGNLSLVQNAVEQMAGDSSLIEIRSRATTHRPFTRIKQLEAAAEATGEAKVQELQSSLNETQQRLSELEQQKKDKDQRFILSPEQKAELENFRKKQAEVSRALKQAQKDLRKEVVSLETHLEWLNILAMPLAVTLAGVLIAMVKRKQTSAK